MTSHSEHVTHHWSFATIVPPKTGPDNKSGAGRPSVPEPVITPPITAVRGEQRPTDTMKVTIRADNKQM